MTRPAPERTTVVMAADWPVVAVASPDQVRSVPVAVVHANRVVACSVHARAAGVQVGLRRRETQRRCPEVVIYERDRAAEARRYEVVAAALDALTPRIEIETPGWCSFATRGPSRYFGGDEAMSLRLVELMADALQGVTAVQVGTADTRFAAIQAAFEAGPGEARVVASGATAAFLAPLPIGVLLRTGGGAGSSAAKSAQAELAEAVHVLTRLGLTSLGDFAELTVDDVAGRFAAVGLTAHRQARGEESRLAAWREPPSDLEVSIDLDPPVERVDQAAFIAKALADEFCGALGARGLTCSRVGIGGVTERGEELVRLWRGEGSLSAGAIADRMRWQLDGWLSGTNGVRPNAGLVRLWLSPDQVMAATGRQMGFWGEQTHNTERAVRAVARTQGILGEGSVTVAEPAGGRSPAELMARVPAEAVDLADRVGRTVRMQRAQGSWPGQIPRPFPMVVHSAPARVEVCDEANAAVRVGPRGIISDPPASVGIASQPPVAVTAWAGPWLVDERWWDPSRHRRSARLQVLLADGTALLLICRRGVWYREAVYA